MKRFLNSASETLIPSTSNLSLEDQPPSYVEASNSTSHTRTESKGKNVSEKDKSSSRYVYYQIYGISERVALINPCNGLYVGRVDLADVPLPKNLAAIQTCINELVGFDSSALQTYLGPKALKSQAISTASPKMFTPRTGYPGCDLDKPIVFVITGKLGAFEHTNFVPKLSHDMTLAEDRIYYRVFQNGRRTTPAHAAPHLPYVGYVSVKHLRPGADILCLKNRIGIAEGKRIVHIFRDCNSVEPLAEPSLVDKRLGASTGRPLAVICDKPFSSVMQKWVASDRSDWWPKRLKGHSSIIDCVAFSPNNLFVASASRDNTVRLWNVLNGENTRVISYTPSHGSSHAIGLIWYPDGHKVAVAFTDATIRIWEARTGKSHLVIESKGPEEILCASISPDGRLLISGGQDNTIRRMSASTGERAGKDWTHHPQSVHSIHYHPDGTQIATACADGLIRLLGSEYGDVLKVFVKYDTAPILLVKFSPDGRTIASGSRDGYIRLWDPDVGDTFSPETKFEHPSDGDEKDLRTISGIVFTPDSSAILSAGSSDMTVMWDTTTKGHLDYKHGVHIIGYNDARKIDQPIDFSTDGRHFVRGLWSNMVELRTLHHDRIK